jgi:hypothetical protein
MSPAAGNLRRRHPVAGIVLAIGVAVGTAVVADGATREAGTVPSRSAGPPVSSIVSDCASMGTVISGALAATAPGVPAATVGSARGRAVAVARSTTSDDVRELAQNLADDLAAYRVAVSSSSAEAAQRRADIGAMVRGDLDALRRLCGR